MSGARGRGSARLAHRVSSASLKQQPGKTCNAARVSNRTVTCLNSKDGRLRGLIICQAALDFVLLHHPAMCFASLFDVGLYSRWKPLILKRQEDAIIFRRPARDSPLGRAGYKPWSEVRQDCLGYVSTRYYGRLAALHQT